MRIQAEAESVSSVKRAGAGLEGSRIEYVDVARGMLIILMFAVHAATPCAPLFRERIQGLWIFEIATTGFAMMAGYAVALRYEWKVRTDVAWRLWSRCGEILVVMFWSNLVLNGAKLYAEHKLDYEVFPKWFVGLLTFQTEYNISGVLFSLALLLPLLSIILLLEGRVGRWGAWGIFSLLLVGIIVLKMIDIQTPALKHLKTVLLVGPGGFAVLEFVGYGLVGFAGARLIQVYQDSGWPFGKIVTVVLGTVMLSQLMIAAVIQAEPPQGSLLTLLSTMNPFAKAASMFLGVLLLASGYVQVLSQRGELELFSLLGRYSLFAFVFHRFVAQVLITGLGLQGGELPTFVLVLSGITVVTYWVCRIRASKGWLNQVLAKWYL